jgi:uncharacterized protein YeaO (DUF488 family)
MKKIEIKRAYAPVAASDGVRILVDRLWPRGKKETELHLDAWLKDIAPSSSLRKWFSHDPEKWKEFQTKYMHELEENPESWELLLELLKKEKVTLIYSAQDEEHNNALCLKHFLEKKLTKKRR